MKLDKKIKVVGATALVGVMLSLGIKTNTQVYNVEEPVTAIIETVDFKSDNKIDEQEEKKKAEEKKKQEEKKKAEEKKKQEEKKKAEEKKKQEEKKKAEEKKKQEEKRKAEDITYHSDIKFNVNVVGNPLYADSLYNILYTMPEGLKEFFTVHNINITMFEDENGAENAWLEQMHEGTGSITGFTVKDFVTDETFVFIEASIHSGYYEKYSDISSSFTEEEFNYLIARDTLVHELGHFIDAKYDYGLSGAGDFADIHQAEVDGYLNTIHYNLDNLRVYANVATPLEYFATAFYSYVCYPENLKENCPRTYDYLDNIVKNINMEYYPENINYSYTLGR